jgi:hypothetical protein
MKLMKERRLQEQWENGWAARLRAKLIECWYFLPFTVLRYYDYFGAPSEVNGKVFAIPDERKLLPIESTLHLNPLTSKTSVSFML